METVATLAVGLVVDMSGAFKQIDTGMGKLANLAATAGKGIAVGIGVGTAALVAFGKKSVDMAMTFESQMAIMSTAVEPMGPSMEELHTAMLKVGADNELIGITATEAAEATTNFYKAGLATNDIFGDYNAYMEEGASLTGALRASIDLAAASDLELAGASEIVAVAMATYGKSAEEATSITDAYVKAADASQAEVSDLAIAMSYVGPTAAQMNIELEDTLVALAMLSEGGIKGSSAGTALNRVLTDLTKGTPRSTKALKELGIEIYDSTGAMRPFNEILVDLARSFEGMTDTERDAAQQAIFTTQGRRGLNVLLSQGVDAWDKMAEKVESASSAEAVAAARTATFAGTMEKLGGTVETLQIMAGDALLPILGQLADMFNEFVGTYTPQITAVFEKFAGTIGVLFASISTGQGVLDTLRATLTYLLPEDVVTRIMNAVTAITDFVAIIVDAISPFVEWKDILIALGVGLAVVLVPILASLAQVIAVIAGVIAAVAVLRNTWEKDFLGIRTAAEKVVGWLRAAWQIVLDIFEDTGVKEALGELMNAFRELWAAIKPVLEDLWKLAKEVFGTKGAGGSLETFAKVVTWVVKQVVKQIKKLTKIIRAAAKLLTKLWKTHGKDLMKIAKNMWDAIFKTISTVLKVIAKFVRMWQKIFKGDWKGAWEEIKDIVELIWKLIVDLIELAIDNITRVVKMWFKQMKLLFENAWNKVKDIVENAWEDIERIIKSISEDIHRTIDSWLNVLKNLFTNAWNKIKDIIESAWDAIERTIESVSDSIRRTIDSWLNALKGLFDDAWNRIKTIIDNAWNAIKSTVESVSSTILNTINSWLSAIKSAFETMWNALAGVVQTAMEAVHNVVDTALRALADIIAVGGAVWNIIMNIGRSIANAIISGFQAVADFASRIVTQLGVWMHNIATNAGNVAQYLISWAKAVGIEIMNWIVGGIQSVTTFISGLIAALRTRLFKIVNNVGGLAQAIINEAKRIGGKVIDWIIDGIKGFVGFAQAVKDTIVGWLREIFGLHSISLDQMGMSIGERLAQMLLAGFIGQRGNISRGIKDELAGWMASAGGLPLTTIIGQAPGGLAGGAGGNYAATFNTNVYNEMDLRQLEFMVQEVLRDMSKRGY